MLKWRTTNFPTLFFIALLLLTGCSRQKDLERLNQEQARVIAELHEQAGKLQSELDQLKESKGELEKVKSELESKLKDELAGGDLSVALSERGLVVTVLDSVLFDSGRTELKESAKSTLAKVASVLTAKVPDHLVYVEGHTDNEPIRHSGWRSNWELSTARATEVIHSFIDSQAVAPDHLIATGYGEFHPVASNETEAGKAKNRRVEIVISPKKLAELEKRPIART